MRNFHQYGIETNGRNSGKIKTICPQCNDTRGNKGDKSLSVNLSEGVCYCHHCGYKLHVPDDAEERQRREHREPVSYTHLDVYKRQEVLYSLLPISY